MDFKKLLAISILAHLVWAVDGDSGQKKKFRLGSLFNTRKMKKDAAAKIEEKMALNKLAREINKTIRTRITELQSRANQLGQAATNKFGQVVGAVAANPAMGYINTGAINYNPGYVNGAAAGAAAPVANTLNTVAG